MSEPGKTVRRIWRARAIAAVGVLALCLLGFLWYIGLLDGNVRTVVPGRVYRSAQLSPGQLAKLIREHQIRTVINLRGGDGDEPWFLQEAAVCRKEGARFQTVSLRATSLPPPEELRRLLKDFDEAEYPVLFHCRGGADRTGLTATLYLNVYQGLPLDEAEPRGLSWRFGHFTWSAGAMNYFFDLYRRDARGLDLRRWITDRYPAAYAAARHKVSAPAAARPVPANIASL